MDSKVLNLQKITQNSKPLKSKTLEILARSKRKVFCFVHWLYKCLKYNISKRFYKKMFEIL